MTVFVLEIGSYSQRCVVGVYATAERAIGAHPYGQWQPQHDGVMRRWANNDGDTADITEYAVIEGPL